MTTMSPSMSAVSLGSRVFTLADQHAFARASHDVNPMHVDPVAARRLLTGQPVVHGIHTLLCALDRWQGETPVVPLRVECEFRQPISIDEPVAFEQRFLDDGRLLLTASVSGVVCTHVVVGPAAIPASEAAIDDGPPAERLDVSTVPLEGAITDRVGQAWLLQDWAPSVAGQFPSACARLGAPALGALAGLSYVVGMVCPGMHSVFSSLSFSLDGPAGAPAAGLRVGVTACEPRFRRVTMSFRGPIVGELQAFERPRALAQPAAREVAAMVTRGEFTGRHALVVGGSRGLGELTAKILASGGADVVVSYASGSADAQAIADDINAQGHGRCSVMRWDLSDPGIAETLAQAGPLDEVYFFATPRIYRKAASTFDRAAFDTFVDFYIDRFAAMCHALEQAAAERPVRVYVPSTVFIEERPRGMTAYAMVKAAAEILADDLNRSLRRVRVCHSRLPRLATDQTAGVRGLSPEANVAVLLELVRSMRA
jgi:NAD(P)-dependent dehydrogenase (short-subunit alcohol dehydrogenase family)